MQSNLLFLMEIWAVLYEEIQTDAMHMQEFQNEIFSQRHQYTTGRSSYHIIQKEMFLIRNEISSSTRGGDKFKYKNIKRSH